MKLKFHKMRLLKETQRKQSFERKILELQFWDQKKLLDKERQGFTSCNR